MAIARPADRLVPLPGHMLHADYQGQAVTQMAPEIWRVEHQLRRSIEALLA
jgi:hypothetical protein